MSLDTIFVIAGLMALSLIFIMLMFARLYRKAGPHEALVVYGFRGCRVIKGRGTVIFPMVENCRSLSLELMSFDVAPQQDLYTQQGVAVTVEAVAQIKVKSDTESILTASGQFLTKTPQEREGLIRLVMEGHLRGIIGQLTVEQIVKEPEMVSARMRANVAEDLAKMGLEVISFTLKQVRDRNEYIEAMGKPDVARIKRDAYDMSAAVAASRVVEFQVAPTAGLPTVASVAFLTGGTKGGTTNAAVQAALQAAALVQGNFVVPLFSCDAATDIALGDTDVTVGGGKNNGVISSSISSVRMAARLSSGLFPDPHLGE